MVKVFDVKSALTLSGSAFHILESPFLAYVVGCSITIYVIYTSTQAKPLANCPLQVLLSSA